MMMSQRTIARRSIAQIQAQAQTRSLHSTTKTLAKFESVNSPKPSSQGHTTYKTGSGLGAEKDVQSAAAGAAQRSGGEAASAVAKEETEKAKKEAVTENQKAATGSFQDHRGGVGGQGEGGNGEAGAEVVKGDVEEAAAPSVIGTISQSLGLGTSKSQHQESKSGPGSGLPQDSHSTAGVRRKYSTSAFVNGKRGFSSSVSVKADGNDAAKRDGEGAREAKHEDGKLGGEQNAHLKHHDAGDKDTGKGNAAPNPSLPSKSTTTNSSRSFSTSAIGRAAEDKSSTAEKFMEDATGAAKEDQKVEGKEAEKIRKEGADGVESSTGEVGPNATIPGGAKSRPSQTPSSGTKAPTRLFSTSAISRAAEDKSSTAEKFMEDATGAVKEDQKVEGKEVEKIRKQGADGVETSTGEAGPNATIPGSAKSRPSQTPSSGTKASTRLFSTSAYNRFPVTFAAQVGAAGSSSTEATSGASPGTGSKAAGGGQTEGTGPKAGYVMATEAKGTAGYDAPAGPYPSTQSYDPLPKVDSGSVKPSSETTFSSTSQGPAHEVTSKQAMDGTLPNRNRGPEAKDGEMGKDEAWKIRNEEYKKK